MLRRGSRRQGHHLFSAGRADLILMQIATSHLSNLATVTELGDKVDNSAALYGTVPDLSIPRRNSRCAIPYFDNRIRDCSPVHVFLLPASGCCSCRQ